jgi:hypothetical protein
MGEENKVPEAPEIKPEKTEKPKKARLRGAAPAGTAAEVETELTQEEGEPAEASTENEVVTEDLRQQDTTAPTQASVPGTGAKEAKPIARHPLAFELRVPRRSR